MTLLADDKEKITQLLKGIRQVHRREMWALSAAWAFSCVASGLIGAFYGLQAIETLFAVFAVFLAGMFIWNWVRRSFSRQQKSNA